ncbi:hypothetical protein [Listeria newyorkensis]|uniref:hypothetical protein n=1 Tax=Listeria newyorkensis TaxID=1497681 RepID=UPI00051D715D|nr:hypothetical protein [Listeria newyorkensis]KGL44103.1 hypothetical protein EP58_06545 [Listeria newyorkensis]SQC57479.1 Uncharacterised protein [Listeria newyorkensis]
MKQTGNQIIKNIRDSWFKDHVATVTGFDGITIIKWRNPKCFQYHMEYILRDHNLFISGDIGSAVYNLTWQAKLGSFKNINVGYFTEKLACSERDKYDYDDFEEGTKRFINEHFYDDMKEHKEELEEIKQELSDPSYYGEFGPFEAWLRAEEVSSKIELDGELGECYSREVRSLNAVFYAYLIGLQMIEEQILDKG